jgi:hypothetical protein
MGWFCHLHKMAFFAEWEWIAHLHAWHGEETNDDTATA